MTVNLFVDTNVFLSFYHFTEDDLGQLRSLFVLSNQGGVKFLLTQQVIDEFWRNREQQIARSIKQLESGFDTGIPVVFQELDEFGPLKSATDALVAARKNALAALREKAMQRELLADKLVTDIFDAAEDLPTTDTSLLKAERRAKLGNPPGKQGSLGDAINWETVLAHGEFLDDLHFITRDSDYQSALDTSTIADFLREEWSLENFSVIHFHKDLKGFLRDNFPSVEIEAFEKTGSLVNELLTAESSFDAHLAVSKLVAVDWFSRRQIDRLIDAATENSKVRSVSEDEDVRQFYLGVLRTHCGILTNGQKERLELICGIDREHSVTDDEILF